MICLIWVGLTCLQALLLLARASENGAHRFHAVAICDSDNVLSETCIVLTKAWKEGADESGEKWMRADKLIAA